MPVKLPAQVRPQPTEYAAYYEKYVSLVPGTDIVGVLEAQRMLTTQLLGARSEREGNFRYAADKWTVKEVVGHLCPSICRQRSENFLHVRCAPRAVAS